MPLKSVKIENWPARAVLLLIALLTIGGAYTSARWGFANTVSTRTEYREVADWATGAAPSDPQTHYASAVLHEKSFLPEDFQKALAEYEQAAALAPHDYLVWLALGKARERAGDAEGAEKALRRARMLAPNYAQVRWTLGNVLLRRGKTSEAFEEIRRAAESDVKYIEPAVAAAWQTTGGDTAQIEKLVGGSMRVCAAMAGFLAKQKRFDEAFEIWNAIAESERKTTYKSSGEEFFRQLAEAKKFRAAQTVQQQISDAQTAPEVGKITNGDFEAQLKSADAALFDWKIDVGEQPQIGPSEQTKRGGGRSLLLVYNSPDGKISRSVAQTIVVEAGKTYEFEAFYKSELKASATLRWEIADAADGKIIAATEPVAAVNGDWTSLKAKFTVPAGGAEAVVVRLARAGCSGANCAIFGRIWFDDLSLR